MQYAVHMRAILDWECNMHNRKLHRQNLSLTFEQSLTRASMSLHLQAGHVPCTLHDNEGLHSEGFVPESPKNKLTSSLAPTLQPECRERMPRLGMR